MVFGEFCDRQSSEPTIKTNSNEKIPGCIKRVEIFPSFSITLLVTSWEKEHRRLQKTPNRRGYVGIQEGSDYPPWNKSEYIKAPENQLCWPMKAFLLGTISDYFSRDFWYPNLPKILTYLGVFTRLSFEMLLLMEKIQENHLGCDRNLVNNGKNYQPQLLSRISEPSVSQYQDIFRKSWTILKQWILNGPLFFLEKKEVRKMIREYIPNPWQKRFHVDTTWAVGKKKPVGLRVQGI